MQTPSQEADGNDREAQYFHDMKQQKIEEEEAKKKEREQKLAAMTEDERAAFLDGGKAKRDPRKGEGKTFKDTCEICRWEQEEEKDRVVAGEKRKRKQQ